MFENDIEDRKIKALQVIMRAHLYPNAKVNDPATPLVTISREFGAGGSEIGRHLADQLGVPFYDRELLDAVVEKARGDRLLMERLDEQVTSFMDDLIGGMMGQKVHSRQEYIDTLIKVLHNISLKGGVIIGRGAHLLIWKPKVFRLRVEASADMAVQRVADRLGVRRSKAQRVIQTTNKEREKFVKILFERFPNRRHFYDMVINSDLMPAEKTARIVLLAMKEAGFRVPAEKVAGGGAVPEQRVALVS